jgi:hypothetical protein
MDENKLQALHEIGYTIPPRCGGCVHFRGIGDWGTCTLTSYMHLKHTGPEREASVHAAGVCSRHEASPAATAALGAFSVFTGPGHGFNVAAYSSSAPSAQPGRF